MEATTREEKRAIREAVARSEKQAAAKRALLSTDHPLLKQNLRDIEVYKGKGRGGVYFVTTEDGRKWVVKPVNQGDGCYNNPNPENARTDINQPQAGLFNDEPGESEVTASQLAIGLHMRQPVEFIVIDVNQEKFKALSGPIPKKTGIIQTHTLCTVQRYLEGETLDRSFRNFAKQHIVLHAMSFSLVAKYMVDEQLKETDFVTDYLAAEKMAAKEIIEKDLKSVDPCDKQLVEIMKLNNHELIDKELLENKNLVAKYMLKTNRVTNKIVDLLGIDKLGESLKSQGVYEEVEEKLNEVICQIGPDNFDENMLLVLTLGEQDGHLDNYFVGKDPENPGFRYLDDPNNDTRLFKLDNGTTLTRMHGFLNTGLVNFNTHPSYGRKLSEHFKKKVREIDHEKDIKIMQGNGKDPVACEKYRGRVEQLKCLAEMEGMTPKKLIAIMESSVLLLKEKGIDMTNLFITEWNVIIPEVFTESAFALIEAEREWLRKELLNPFEKLDLHQVLQVKHALNFFHAVHGMTLANSECGMEDLIDYKELTPGFIAGLIENSKNALGISEHLDSGGRLTLFI